MEVFGYRDAKCQDYMVAIGKSLQYTNILRDIGNDAERGRIYLPQEAMEKFGVEPRSILNGKYSTAFIISQPRWLCAHGNIFKTPSSCCLRAIGVP